MPALRRTAWIEIDLEAVADNLRTIRTLAGGVAVLPVVKADAYGHGMVPVARALEAAGADALCVATLDEAIALREAGIAAEVILLYPPPRDGIADSARMGITISASAETKGDLRPEALADVGTGRRLRIEIEVETGLGRGGVEPDDASRLARRIAGSGAELTGVWSHLQATEVQSITDAQVARFDAAVAAVRSEGMGVPRRHLGASAAIVLGNAPRYEAVRPGLITYGLLPDELIGDRKDRTRLAPGANDLRPVLSLVARPVRVADLEEGHGVSYGPTWQASRKTRVATLPIGYGDGWSRALSNRAEVLIRGVRAPVVGTVAMDATMVDVTDVPGDPVNVDDEFVLIGRQGDEEIAAADVGRWRNTISWEVVTALSGRLTRVYHAAAGPVRP